MIYLAAPTWDESRKEYRTAWLLRLNETRFFAFVYKPDASTLNRLILEDENGDILRYDLNEYKMVCSRSAREGCGTWEYWNLRLEGYTMEVSVLSWTFSGDPQERTLLSDLLHSTEPISLTAGVLFLVRVPPNDMPATTSTPLPAEQPTPAPTPAPKPFQLTPTPAKQHDAKPDDIFMPNIRDEELKLVGLSRSFVKAVWRIVQERGKVSFKDLIILLGLPARSNRLKFALSFLVQEGLIYELADHHYSNKPSGPPAPDELLMRVLNAICDHPGINSRDLIRRTQISDESFTPIVRYLAAQGLIRRKLVALPHPSDPRLSRITWLHYPAERTGGQR
jgi:hypothetical protein